VRQFISGALIIAATAAAATSSHADDPRRTETVETSELTAEDAAVIGEAFNLRKEMGDRVWMGWSKIATPMIYIAKDREYAIDFPKALADAKPFESKFLVGRSIQVRERKHAPTLAASFDVEGINAVVIGRPAVIERTPSVWVITALHEMFHVLQASRGSSAKVQELKIGPANAASWQLNFPFPYKDADAQHLIHLQGFLCYLGATSANEDESRYLAGSAQEAFDLYKKFLDQLDPKGAFGNYSKFQEWTEGAALYTEYKISEAAAEKYQPTEAFRRLSGFTSYADLWNNRYRGQTFLAKHAGRAATGRLTFYHLGFAKCLLLDKLSPDWKKRYFDKENWLDDLVAEALKSQQSCKP
jgi:hypothetical protein